MVHTVGAANNGASNPSTLSSNTAKSLARATQNLSVRTVLRPDNIKENDRAMFIASDHCSKPDGTFEKLEKLKNMKDGGRPEPLEALSRATIGGNPDGLRLRNCTALLFQLYKLHVKKDGGNSFLLIGPRGHVKVTRDGRFSKVFKLLSHEANNDNAFYKEKYSEINDSFTLSVLRTLCDEETVNRILSGSSSDDVDSALSETEDDLDEPNTTNNRPFPYFSLTAMAAGAELCPRSESNSNADANSPRRNSIAESYDGSVFHEDEGRTEERNHEEPTYSVVGPRNRDTGSESSMASVSSIGRRSYTRQWSEIGNARNEAAQADEPSNSLESGTSTSNSPRTGFAEQTTIKQRMPTANENKLYLVGSDGLPLKTKKSHQSDTTEEPALQEEISLDSNMLEPEFQEDIIRCLSSFQSSQEADLKKINDAKLQLEKLQQSDLDSVSASGIEFIRQKLEERSKVQDLYQKFQVEDAENMKQLQMMRDDIARSGKKMEDDSTSLRIDSLTRAAWNNQRQMVEQIEELMPTEEIVENIARLSAQREASSPSGIKTTAGSALKSSSSVVDINSAFRPDDFTYNSTFYISPDGVVATTETLNGSESTTTPIPGSPSGFRAGTNFGGVQNIAGKMNSEIEKNKRKAVKNTPPKGTAEIQS